MDYQAKIQNLKKAAKAHSVNAEKVVLAALARGAEHMTYKDFREFDCVSQEQYIYQEAEHLIEQFDLDI